MENTIKVYQKIARELAVINNEKADNEWVERAFDNIAYIEKEILPYGSGFDNGCKISIEKSTANKIVIECNFHHMNDNGYYDGWTYHNCIITPDLAYGLDMKVTGRDKRGIKSYILETIYHAINAEIINKTHY